MRRQGVSWQMSISNLCTMCWMNIRNLLLSIFNKHAETSTLRGAENRSISCQQNARDFSLLFVVPPENLVAQLYKGAALNLGRFIYLGNLDQGRPIKLTKMKQV